MTGKSVRHVKIEVFKSTAAQTFIYKSLNVVHLHCRLLRVPRVPWKDSWLLIIAPSANGSASCWSLFGLLAAWARSSQSSVWMCMAWLYDSDLQGLQKRGHKDPAWQNGYHLEGLRSSGLASLGWRSFVATFRWDFFCSLAFERANIVNRCAQEGCQEASSQR